jgi:hypothetical protein
LKKFRGVFAKIWHSGIFQNLKNYFTKEKGSGKHLTKTQGPNYKILGIIDLRNKFSKGNSME